MLTKNDLFLLLTELENEGYNIQKAVTLLYKTEGISKEVLKIINDNRHLDVADFYTLLRKNYNHKKSNIYINLVKEEFDNPNDVLITLAALNLQIMLYANKLENNQMFLKHSRGEEITQVLNNYYKTYDLIPCLKVLRIIKADLKSFETLK